MPCRTLNSYTEEAQVTYSLDLLCTVSTQLKPNTPYINAYRIMESSSLVNAVGGGYFLPIEATCDLLKGIQREAESFIERKEDQGIIEERAARELRSREKRSR